jgi:hypothetical protein
VPAHRLGCAIVAATVFLIVPASVVAQQVGVKGGLNLASLPPEEDENPDIPPRLGPIGGLWVRTAPVSRFSFQAEALFSEKGTHWDFSPEVSVEIRIRYIEIPLLVRSDFGAAASASRLFVIGGAAPAFKLSALSKFQFLDEEGTRDAGRDIEPFDLGLVGGLGVELGPAQIEARYTHGLLRINTDDNEPNDRLNNRVFSVTIGFRLR